MIRVKICGVTTPADAEACVRAGADLIGVNFVATSPRRVSIELGRQIAGAVRGATIVVGVVAAGPSADAATLAHLREEAGVDRLQLHGDEPPDVVRALGSIAIKALRIATLEDAALADRYEGLLLLDAKVEGALGGTGRRLDPALALPIAQRRDVLLAGGLDPENVADAVRAVRPWGVDVASGVESRPGVKDMAKVRAFIAAARGA